MKHMRALVFALSVTLPMMAASAEEKPAAPAEKSAPPAKCLVAEVNPVTGHAVCINPRGAPVESPPAAALHPCKPRAQDKDDWTVYEHWSGC
ncbi:MAG: hypothetical protein ABI457_11830 [Hyphomicrobium sp.]